MNKMREEMAAAFLAALKEDEIPWRRGWTVNNVQNAITGKEYNGINRLWLSYVSEVNKYDDPRWCTYKQAADKGWQVKKGEKGTRVEFWSLYDTEKKKKLSYRESKKLLDEIGKEEYDKRVKPISNIYSVFNGEQIEGIPEYELNTYTVVNPDEILLYRDKLLTNMNLGFNERGESAFYRESEDAVTMPVMEKFDNNYAYMSVFLHECGHATGHKSRLSRDLSGTFGSEKYAKEELRAEISSAFTTAELGINPGEETEHMKNHKAYVQNWISVLENDPNELFRAIKDAEKISDYLIEKGEFKLKKEEQEISATYKLYQMNEGEKYHGRHFEPLEYNKKHGNLTMDDYHFVYGGNFDEVEGNTTIDKLNSLYSSFNGETKPEGYTGYSMSTSDVVVITDAKAGTETAFYCDRYGFQEYPEFLQKEEIVSEQTVPEQITSPAELELTFAEQVERVLAGDKKLARKPLTIGKTPNSLVICGADKDLDIQITKSVIDKALRPEVRDETGKITGKTGHGLTVEQLLNAINNINNPVMVLKGSKENSLVAVTEFKDNNDRQIIVTVEMNKTGSCGEVNNITSTYGRDSFAEYIEKQLINGNMIAANKKKS